MSDSGRIQIRRCFEQAMISIRTDALNQLTDYCKDMDHGSRRKYISNLIERICISGVDDLDLETLKDLLVAKKTQLRSGADFEVFESLDWPNYVYDLASKAMVPKNRKDHEEYEIHTINAVQRERLEFIWKSCDTKGIDKIEALLCEHSKKSRILATIFKDLEDTIYAQDTTGQVIFEITDTTKYEEDAFFFYGGIFLCEGEYNDGTFTARKVSLPVLKDEEELPSIIPTDVLNRKPFDAPKNSDCIVILSDIFLDNQNVIDSLTQLFIGYSEAPPTMFIFCGSFRSVVLDLSKIDDTERDFQKLEKAMSTYRGVYKSTQFVFIAGPKDPPCNGRLPSLLMESAKSVFASWSNVHFAANPSKILFKNKVIQLTRDDVVEKLSQHTFYLSENADVGTAFSRTIWSQRNALPVHPKGSAIRFGDVHDFKIMPDLLVLADQFQPYRWRPPGNEENEPKIVNPGVFSIEPFKFMTYYPKDGKIDLNSIH
ncbi:unnamed protein product [Bursaphelenchus xylophilus]|uniref:DNA polymerase II subunit 2 n=1 Tax=Bursaphelenchus xylophilus TaxID=6326 RepID=A0A1I7RHT2_BURXY|nr:unnamed protein product [Bursaphelenchus xylophilus]CAG9115412.1 unnamed protein product [Bursaphelenchus xylophilus]